MYVVRASHNLLALMIDLLSKMKECYTKMLTKNGAQKVVVPDTYRQTILYNNRYLILAAAFRHMLNAKWNEPKVLLATYGDRYLQLRPKLWYLVIGNGPLKNIRGGRRYFHKVVYWNLCPLIYLDPSSRQRQEIDLWTWGPTDAVSWREPSRNHWWQHHWWLQSCRNTW